MLLCFVGWLQNTAADKKQGQRWTTVELVLMAAVALLLLPLLYTWRAFRAASRKASTAAAPAAAGSPAKCSKKAKAKKSNKSSNKSAAAADDADADADASELQQLTATSAVNGLEPGFDPVAVAASAPAISSSGGFEPLARSSSEMQALLAAGAALHAGASGQASRAGSAAGAIRGLGSPVRSPTPSDPGALSPVPDVGASGNTPGMMTTRSYVDEDGAVVIGRLRVGPGILGYGSAGEAAAADHWWSATGMWRLQSLALPPASCSRHAPQPLLSLASHQEATWQALTHHTVDTGAARVAALR